MKKIPLTAQCCAIGNALSVPKHSADLHFSCPLLNGAVCIYAKIWFSNQLASVSVKVVGKVTA